MGVHVRLFRTITELVDKDVAANSKPISIIGILLPFVPFMIFVDGAPANSYPVLAGLALAVSISWLSFVTWRYVRHLRMKLAGTRKSLGTFRFWVLVSGTVLFIMLFAMGGIWLSEKIGWPEAYGFACHGRGCFFQDLANSPMLLRGGSAYELGLFALLWLFPAFLIGLLIYALFKRLKRDDHIRPMD